MLTFIIRRLLITSLLLVVISVVSFAIFTLTPGSPFPWADLNPKISPAVKENYRKKFHLDQPLHKQYWFIMSGMLTGKLTSIKDERPVLEKIGERLPATLRLNLTSLIIDTIFGITLGVYAARYAGRAPDTITSILAFVFIALPGFWVAYLVVIFLVQCAGTPLFGTHTLGVNLHGNFQIALDEMWHLLVPSSILAIGGIAAQSRYMRASMIESLSEDYIRTARAKGLSDEVVLYKHAFRNSVRPLITGIGYLLPELIGGSVIIETIFAYPGMGRLAYDAALARDYPVLMTFNFIGALLILLGNLIADVLYAVVDPRVRLQ